MADNLDSWVTRRTIKQNFVGKDSTLKNALYTLRKRDIIISKEGEKGIYRLQQKAFALWIKIHDLESTKKNPLLTETSSQISNFYSRFYTREKKEATLARDQYYYEDELKKKR